MNTIKAALKDAGFSIHAGNGAIVALIGKRPNRVDVEIDLIDGKVMLTITRNGDEEAVSWVADEAAAMAALIAAGILPAPVATVKTVRFTADLNRRAWAIRREAAARFGLKVTAISWAECLKLARA